MTQQTLTEKQITAIIQKANPTSKNCHFCGQLKEVDKALSTCYACTQKMLSGNSPSCACDSCTGKLGMQLIADVKNGRCL